MKKRRAQIVANENIGLDSTPHFTCDDDDDDDGQQVCLRTFNQNSVI